MKNTFALCLVFILLTVTSCELMGDIFSAGFYTGLFLVVIVIAIIIFIIAKMNKRR